jgi:alkylation response protein AidB-like acyl-CoA dehydrogenase
MRLSEEQRAWQLKARKFAEEELRPISLERDQTADPRETFDWDIIKKGSQLGFRTAVVPKEFGGHGIDFVSQVLVMAELARGDSAISKTFSQCWKWSHLIAASCTRDQQERFLKPFIEDDTYLLGKAGTEPHAGSDNRMQPDDPETGWSMSAERDGDEWVLNGVKRYIANGSVAKLFFVDTRTDPSVSIREGTTLFLVPADTPGFRVGKVYDKIGWRFYQNAELIFEDVRVPHANIVGEVNGGVKARAGDTSEFGDLELAANGLGVCEAALEMAVEHARNRRQGGKQIIEHQAIQLKLTEMHMLTEALRSFTIRTAEEAQADEKKNNIALMNFATDVIQRVTHLNMDVHGGAGVMKDVGAEKLVRDAAIWTHLAGDSVQRLKAMKEFT